MNSSGPAGGLSGECARKTQLEDDRTTERRTHPNPAAAGSLLLGTIVALGGAGYGVGALVGAALPLAIAGVFAGFALGMSLVYRRYRDI